MTLIWALVIASQAGTNPPMADTHAVEAIVQQIRKADYEDDRASLKRLHAELEPFVSDRTISARVRYWRGFAMWRRALNGFNDGADHAELGQDLDECVADFRAVLVDEPSSADAKAGAASCLVNHSFLLMKTDATQARTMFEESIVLLNQALAVAPDNPRVLWVHGTNQFYSRVADEKAAAFRTYERGLALARGQNGKAMPPLDPTWGEAELLMNLAFANFKKPRPDLEAATHYAEQALALVPNWHYVRDVLLPAIRTAKGEQRTDRSGQV